MPDPTIAAGPTELVLAVNAVWAAFSKANPPVPVFRTSFLEWLRPFGSEYLEKIFDPWVVYDQGSERFFMLITGYNLADQQSFLFLMNSLSSSATGEWCVNKIDVNFGVPGGALVWADYPKIGIDQDGVYLTSNDYTIVGVSRFAFASAYVMPKASLLTCSPLRMTRFIGLMNTDGSRSFTVQPALTLGASGGYEYMMNVHVPATTYPRGVAASLWRISGPRNDPSLARANILSPETYSSPPPAAQRGSYQTVETLDGRLLNAAYSTGTLWSVQASVHSVSCVVTLDCRSEIRVYGVNVGTGQISQQKYTSPGIHYYNGSIMPNSSSGNITVTMTRSSVVEFPGMFAVQRLTGVWGSVALVKEGEQAAIDPGGGPSRWGDFAGSSVDPDGTRTWIYNEYMKPELNWATWVAALPS